MPRSKTRRPSDSDLEAAVEAANELSGESYRVHDFRLAYLGEMTVEGLKAYDDVDSWLDYSYDDCDQGMSQAACIETMRGFRGGAWINRAKGWLKEGIPPIVVVTTPVTDEGGGTMIGDGRGRVNFASLLGLTVPVWHMIYDPLA
jgi:hypothetical protein